MKLFVTDYDETLHVTDEGMKKTNELLKKLQEKDFLIVIATGRGYPSISNQTVIHNIPYDYITCSDGSVIYNNKGDIEKMFLLNKDIVKPFEDFYKQVNYEEIQYSYPEGYSNILKEDNDKLIGVNICVAKENYTKELIDNFAKMSKNYPEYSFLYYMHTSFAFLCIKPKGVSKSYAVNYLKEKYQIKKEDVYTIGDSANDYEMIKEFNGACVYASFPEILAIAKKQYPSIDDYIKDILKNYSNE